MTIIINKMAVLDDMEVPRWRKCCLAGKNGKNVREFIDIVATTRAAATKTTMIILKYSSLNIVCTYNPYDPCFYIESIFSFL